MVARGCFGFAVGFDVGFDVGVVFDVDLPPLEPLPMTGVENRIRNETCLRWSRGFVGHAPRLRNGVRLQADTRPAREASLFRFPFFRPCQREAEGQRIAAAFLCLLSLAEQRK